MSYNKYTIRKAISQLGVEIDIKVDGLFSEVTEVQPSPNLLECLRDVNHYHIDSEIARRELYISPILREAVKYTNYQVTIYSCIEFHVDKKPLATLAVSERTSSRCFLFNNIYL